MAQTAVERRILRWVSFWATHKYGNIAGAPKPCVASQHSLGYETAIIPMIRSVHLTRGQTRAQQGSRCSGAPSHFRIGTPISINFKLPSLQRARLWTQSVVACLPALLFYIFFKVATTARGYTLHLYPCTIPQSRVNTYSFKPIFFISYDVQPRRRQCTQKVQAHLLTRSFI